MPEYHDRTSLGLRDPRAHPCNFISARSAGLKKHFEIVAFDTRLGLHLCESGHEHVEQKVLATQVNENREACNFKSRET